MAKLKTKYTKITFNIAKNKKGTKTTIDQSGYGSSKEDIASLLTDATYSMIVLAGKYGIPKDNMLNQIDTLWTMIEKEN